MRAASLFVLFLVLFLVSPVIAFADSDWCYDNGDFFFTEVHDGTIVLHHNAAHYNCCPDSITSVWTQEGYAFSVVETAYNPHCICFCCFDLTTSVTQVPPGTYRIDFSWYNNEDWQWHHQILDVFVPEYGSGGPPEHPGSTQSACLDSPSAAPASPAPLPALRDVEPSPFRPGGLIRFELVAGGPAELVIYAAGGVRVRTLYRGSTSAGPHAIAWDGRDDAGRPLASGVYFCGLRTNQGQSALRIVVLE